MHIQFLSRPTVSTSTAIVSAVSRTARWFWSMAVGVNFDLQRNMTIRYVRGRYVTTRPCIECRIPATTAASPAMNPDIFVSQFTCFYRAMLYATAVLAMGLCLSVPVSVRHKSVFYRNGWTNRAGFWHVSFLPTVLHCVKRKFDYLQKWGHFPLELCHKLQT